MKEVKTDERIALKEVKTEERIALKEVKTDERIALKEVKTDERIALKEVKTDERIPLKEVKTNECIAFKKTDKCIILKAAVLRSRFPNQLRKDRGAHCFECLNEVALRTRLLLLHLKSACPRAQQ